MGANDEHVTKEVEGGYVISSDPARLDVDAIHAFLVGAYWSEGIPRDVVERSIEGSLCFGLYLGDEQVGFARAISDHATFAYIGDVYVLDAHRGRGLAKALVGELLDHPRLRGLRRYGLVAPAAHEIYTPFGFQALSAPETHMEIRRPDFYLEAQEGS